MKTNIKTKTDRQKLTPRREPYWERIRGGAYVGFRKLESGEGTWIARWRGEDGKQHYRALGEFSDFDAAVKDAVPWFDQTEGGTSPKATTVEATCKEYVEHLKTHKSEATAKDAKGRFNRLVYGKAIARTELNRLKSSDVRKWLNAQLADVDAEDAEDLRRAKDSANRNLASFKAALNFALKSHLVATDAAWKTVTPFPRSGKRRERFLTLEERRQLLAACPADLQTLVHALLITAARPGEIAAATAGDFDRKAGTLALQGKTGRRIVSLSSAALEFFTKAAKGKLPSAYLVARVDGSQWNKDAWKKVFSRAVKGAHLPTDVVLYSVRHTAISEMIASGIDSFIVARLAGTSTAMIDKHYGHLRHDRTRAKLDQARMV
ncbi:site-specific integrase [Methylocaldum sp.]|uniref:tyrosine-type recombinase/integrase n=1 Tax=Methylocaldum sp. TaxID=1969727 RepID=UPI002D3328EF|nr:site-specific integrase [Methylocaldum sp.]HYE35671.1 site-specific integrase [Methylocaldum sp.]